MDFWRSVGGMVQIQLVSADMEGLLKKLNEKNIALYDLRFQDVLTCRLSIRREDYRRAILMCNDLDASLKIQETKGLYWTIKSLFRRPVLFLGFLMFLTLVLMIPTRVLFLRVEGNNMVPANRILEAAEECGIRFGASRREVRSEKVKNALIGAVPELQWAGINTRGCVATISVKERTPAQEQKEDAVFSSIVAVRDGYVLSASATRGALLVTPGQSVAAGQTLISGYQDLGLISQFTVPEGEIFAQTRWKTETVTPSRWCYLRKTGSVKKKYSVLIGKKRINLWKDSGISGTTCGRMYEEYYVTLPGNFSLPLAFCVETLDAYTYEVFQREESELLSDMEDYSDRYLRKQMIGGEILSSEKQFHQNGRIISLTKHYVCQEMIGRLRQEQIGDIHEQNN